MDDLIQTERSGVAQGGVEVGGIVEDVRTDDPREFGQLAATETAEIDRQAERLVEEVRHRGDQAARRLGRSSAVLASLESPGDPLEAEGEADAAVVAIAAEDAGQAVVTAAAADIDGAVRGRREQLEDHLGIEADAAAEAQVQLDPVGGKAVESE